MFGSGKLKELEAQLASLKNKFENEVKEKAGLAQQLESARSRIQDLEKQLAESENVALKKKAEQTVVEFEALKALYAQKNKEIDAVREETEESFAVEAATRRHALKEEIQQHREANQAMVANTVETFTDSYRYYLDQLRGLMDALSSAVSETSGSLFDGKPQNLKERFGAKILEHLQEKAGTLKQDKGDLLLIGGEEPQEASPAEPGAEEAAEEAAEDAAEAAEEAVEEAAEDAAEAAEEAAEDAAETAEEAAEEAAEDTVKAAEEAAEEAGEALKETAEDFLKEAAGEGDNE